MGGFIMFKITDQLRQEHDRYAAKHRFLALASLRPPTSDSVMRWLQLTFTWLVGVAGIALGVSLILS